MPLVKNILENTLKGIFAAMQDGSKPDAWMADQIGAAIADYIGTGMVSTTDSGAAPAGSYTGAGIGTMAIDAGDLQSKLKTTFEAKHDNDALAANIAANIDAVCAADGTISAMSSGMAAAPTGPIAFSGTGEGAFSGAKSSMESALKSCFSRMDAMAQEGDGTGGDNYLAAQLASAVDAYLKAGTVSVELKDPFTAGSGEGGIT